MRFTTRDTYLGNPNVPSTLNQYAYMGHNPVNYVDPSIKVSNESLNPAEQIKFGNVTATIAPDGDFGLEIPDPKNSSVSYAIGGADDNSRAEFSVVNWSDNHKLYTSTTFVVDRNVNPNSGQGTAVVVGVAVLIGTLAQQILQAIETAPVPVVP